jgi:hypothetical protein
MPRVARSDTRPAAQLPEPGRLWIRYTPRPWPRLARPWTQLATARLGGGPGRSTREPLPEFAAEPLDDVLYLPPVRPELRGERDALARARLADGTPVVVQVAPGEPPPPAGAVAVYDLLEPLLAGELGRLGDLPAGAAAVWPLIAGVSDDPRVWREGCERLAASGAVCLQALGLDLAPGERRLLAAQGGQRAFEELFHGPPPAERDLAVVAAAAGLRPFMSRPLSRPPLAGAGNRRLGEVLGLVGELWLRLGRPVGRGQAFLRAMRWVDRSRRSLEALAREGNLGVLPWLDAESAQLVEEVLLGGSCALLDQLLAEYVGGALRE